MRNFSDSEEEDLIYAQSHSALSRVESKGLFRSSPTSNILEQNSIISQSPSKVTQPVSSTFALLSSSPTNKSNSTDNGSNHISEDRISQENVLLPRDQNIVNSSPDFMKNMVRISKLLSFLFC
jgi:hypothetical protein